MTYINVSLHLSAIRARASSLEHYNIIVCAGVQENANGACFNSLLRQRRNFGLTCISSQHYMVNSI